MHRSRSPTYVPPKCKISLAVKQPTQSMLAVGASSRSNDSSSYSSSSSNSPSLSTAAFFYNTPPEFSLTLDEFEENALSRLIVLRKIEEMHTRSISGTDFAKELIKTLGQYLPAGKSSGSTKEDQTSHFILRLSYCRTEELRRWFLSQEVFLFRFRMEELEREGGKNLSKFIRGAGLTFEKVEKEEKEEKRKFMGFKLSSSEFNSSTFYKIPFVHATDLIKSREVYVIAGFAYVPSSRLISIITSRFRMNLSKNLVAASNMFAEIAEDQVSASEAIQQHVYCL